MASEPAELAPAIHCVDCGKTHPARAALLPTPFRSLMTSNILLPTASEARAIRDFSRDTDAAIAEREGTIAQLLCEVVELRRSSEQHKAIIAPIRRIPSEILAEIFMQATGDEARSLSYYDSTDDEPYMITPRLHRAPLIFGEICREWRALALSLPRLWNSISLECSNDEIQRNIPLCDAWIRRSGLLPLSIHFHRRVPTISSRREDDTGEQCRDLIRSVLPYAARWRVFQLAYLPTRSYAALDGITPESLHRLEHLSVRHNDDVRMTASSWAEFRAAPNLTSLHFDSINGAGIDTGPENPTFPWSQLTHITVGDCSPNDCAQILAQASAAIACTFEVRRTSFLEHTPIFHSHLQTLTIAAFVDPYILWDSLTCAVLATLSIMLDDEQTTPSSSQSLQGFLTRSGTTIEDITLHSSGLRDTQFLECLRSMPMLRHLDVEEMSMDTPFTDLVCEALTVSSVAGEATPPPLVTHLEFLSISADRLCDTPMVHMLKSRVGSTPISANTLPFKKVSLSTGNISNSAYDKLTELQRLGLNLTIDVHGGIDSSEESESSDSDEEDGETDEDTDPDDVSSDSG